MTLKLQIIERKKLLSTKYQMSFYYYIDERRRKFQHEYEHDYAWWQALITINCRQLHSQIHLPFDAKTTTAVAKNI